MKQVLVFLMLISASSFSLATPKGADAQAINAACSGDAAATGCSDKKVGSGLMKCVFSYKKEHKDFKVSDGCRAALKKAKGKHNE